MKFIASMLLILSISFSAAAQMPYETKSYKFKDSPQAKTLEQRISENKGIMGNSQDETEARNLLVLKAVLDYKMGDQKLEPYFEKLKHNREFYQKLARIMKDLDNKKYRNGTNQDILSILDNAGGRLYNNYSN
ncbi:MAG: hypothetical protein IKN67_02585 [Alphaproteobacteria bacterium]|nr:hypothetical protein [Alphaproteobacteria bacterium]